MTQVYLGLGENFPQVSLSYKHGMEKHRKPSFNSKGNLPNVRMLKSQTTLEGLAKILEKSDIKQNSQPLNIRAFLDKTGDK